MAKVDLDRSLSLFPMLGSVRRHRGHVDFMQGDNALARDDLDRAVALNGRDGETVAFRALLSFREQRFGAAFADFETSRELLPGYMYTPRWIDLAGVRFGKHDTTVLHPALDELKDCTQWPGVLVDAFLGEQRAEFVMRQARQASAGHAEPREAQAAFYLGQLALTRGKETEATRYFADRTSQSPGDQRRARHVALTRRRESVGYAMRPSACRSCLRCRPYREPHALRAARH
ncbi:MAG: lipoprotein NlpI [Gammaproteobacteria bacterium]|jgi:lipoprotein NlpI